MALAPRAEAATGRAIEAASRWLAYAGGLILAATAIMVCVSIAGRALGRIPAVDLGPIQGDYELVKAGCGLAVFAFLPWCQLNRGHVAGDIVTGRFPPRVQAVFGLIADILLTVAAYLIAWRLFIAFGTKFPGGSDALRETLGWGYRPFFAETTYELQIPVWTLYLASFVGAVLFLMTALYTVWRGINWVARGAEEAPA